MSEPRVVIRPNGGLVILRGDEVVEQFEVPSWAVGVLAKGRWWMEAFAVGLGATPDPAPLLFDNDEAVERLTVLLAQERLHIGTSRDRALTLIDALRAQP